MYLKMIKKILAISFLFMSFTILAQRQEATLYLRNGEVKKGFAKIVAPQKIKFKAHKSSDKQTYDHKQVSKIDIYNRWDDITTTYTYKLVPSKNSHKSKPMLLETLVTGKISLYRMGKSSVSSFGAPGMGMSVGGGVTVGFGVSPQYVDYYVCRDNVDVVTKLLTLGGISLKKFKEYGAEYFSDCPELVEKIESKYYKKGDIEDVVNFYNNHCSNTNTEI